MKVKTDF